MSQSLCESRAVDAELTSHSDFHAAFPHSLTAGHRTIKGNILQEKLRELLVNQSLRELTSPSRLVYLLRCYRAWPTWAAESTQLQLVVAILTRLTLEKENPEVLVKFTAQSQGLTERPRPHHRPEEHFPSPHTSLPHHKGLLTAVPFTQYIL